VNVNLIVRDFVQNENKKEFRNAKKLKGKAMKRRDRKGNLFSERKGEQGV